MALARGARSPRRFTRRPLPFAAVLLAFLACACTRPGEPRPAPPPGAPSILLFVYDTVRHDAMSAYGGVAATTPTFDRLAAAGLLYTHAWANAPWTLPSHVSLFSGLPVSRHQVGHGGSLRAPDELVLLAERLRGIGYETAGFSENPFLSPAFNTVQGFDRFVNGERAFPPQFAAAAFVAEWLAQRDRTRPFFLFVNVMDAHQPYPVVADSAFLPPGTPAEALQGLDRMVHRRLCANLPPPAEVALLRALYHEGVATADRQLAAVLDAVEGAGAGDGLVTVATSDHGEHFGEHGLMEHNFSVREPLLRVPLVVAGLPDVAPARIDAPVQLLDVVPTLLALLGAEPDAALPGRPLPRTEADAGAPPWIEAAFREPERIDVTDGTPEWVAMARSEARRIRAACTAGERVFGDMTALLRFPHKLVWFEKHPPQLFDLGHDPGEERDIAADNEALVAAMLLALRQSFVAAAAPPPAVGHDLAPGVAEQLRALGYIE